MISLEMLHTISEGLTSEYPRKFWQATKLVGTETAMALLVLSVRKELQTLDLEFLPSSLEELTNETIRRMLGSEILNAFLTPHVSFYMGKYDVLDNFSALSVYSNGFLWPTLEHAYQAEKFTDPKTVQLISQARSPHEAKGFAHMLEEKVRTEWTEVKVEVMRKLIQLKVEQHQVVREVLLASKDLVLIEDSPTDSFWGRGRDWKGKNMRGVLWMERREALLLES